MQSYVCTVCGYTYDPEAGDPDSGIEPGTPFENIPEDWICPVCGAAKDDFEAEQKGEYISILKRDSVENIVARMAIALNRG